MPRYYFHLFNQLDARDEEGRELADQNAATAAAAADIRSILSEDVKLGMLDLRGRIEIADETDTVVGTVHFIDSAQLILPDDIE